MTMHPKENLGGRDRFHGERRDAGKQVVAPANRGDAAGTTDKNRCRTGELSLEEVRKELRRRTGDSPDAPESDEERGADASP